MPSAGHDANAPSLPDVAAGFQAIAACIEEYRSAEALVDALRRAQALCEAVADRAGSPDLKALLPNVQQALKTWQQVWPRLGSERDFRLAVAREARLWSKRLSASDAPTRR